MSRVSPRSLLSSLSSHLSAGGGESTHAHGLRGETLASNGGGERDLIAEMAEALAKIAPPALSAPAGHEEALPRQPNVPAPLPINDFEDDFPDDGPVPIPSTWLLHTLAPQPSWIANQAKAAGFGLLGGLVVVVPLVIVLSGQAGRLNAALLPSPPPPSVGTIKFEKADAASQGSRASAPAEVLIKPRIVITSPIAVPPPTPVEATTAPLSPVIVEARVVEARVVEAGAIEAPPIALALAPTLTPAPIPPVDKNAELRLRASERIAAGDILPARQLLTQAVAAGDADAALLLGETFDPNMLAAWGARGVNPDVGAAQTHYHLALSAGIERARMRLKALD